MRHRVILGLVVFIIILGGCGTKPKEQSQSFTSTDSGERGFVGYIVKKEDNRILVVNSDVRDFSANGGASNYYEAIWFSNVPFNIEVGQHVEVMADGAIADSYPAQGTAGTVSVYEVEKPEGAEFTQEEAIVKALSTSEVSGYEIPVIKEVKYKAATSQWLVYVTQSGDETVHEIRVEDQQTSIPANEIGSKPPLPVIEAEGKVLTVYQSSYCWGSTCADYIGPEEMLKDKPKEQVDASAQITFTFDVKHPTEINLQRFEDGTSTDVKLTDDSFQAPQEPGVYFYNLSAFWMMEGSSTISEGSSSYVFVIEVTDNHLDP